MCQEPRTATHLGAAIGNALNVLVLVVAIAYAATVILYTQPGRVGVLDETWKQDGFCIHNKDVDYLSSFDTCLYVDVLVSALLGFLYWQWRHLPGMETGSAIVPMVILGTLGHGFAHGAMAIKFRDGRYEQEQHLDSSSELAEAKSLPQLIAFCALFWFPLLKATMPKVQSWMVASMAMLVTFAPIWAGGLKKQLGFAYVQTVLSIAFHLSQLVLSSKEKQQREYVTLPLMAIPPVLIAWTEALFCSSFFQSAGGHVWYDASIIVSYVVFYVDCYRNHVGSGKSKTS